MPCATATTAGSAAVPPANSRFICAPRAAPSMLMATAARLTMTPTTRNAGTENSGHWSVNSGQPGAPPLPIQNLLLIGQLYDTGLCQQAAERGACLGRLVERR